MGKVYGEKGVPSFLASVLLSAHVERFSVPPYAGFFKVNFKITPPMWKGTKLQSTPSKSKK